MGLVFKESVQQVRKFHSLKLSILQGMGKRIQVPVTQSINLINQTTTAFAPRNK